MFRGPYFTWFNMENVFVWRAGEDYDTPAWNTDSPLPSDAWTVEEKEDAE